jgi:hypothetical protein
MYLVASECYSIYFSPRIIFRFRGPIATRTTDKWNNILKAFAKLSIFHHNPTTPIASNRFHNRFRNKLSANPLKLNTNVSTALRTVAIIALIVSAAMWALQLSTTFFTVYAFLASTAFEEATTPSYLDTVFNSFKLSRHNYSCW